MGSVFRGGNTNVVAKINNHKISTKDFMSHINYLNLSNEMIRENISIFDEVMSNLINKKLLLLEMDELNIKISDSSLSKILKKNINFLDENNNFSRIKYEKYLITNNLSATIFEENLRHNEKKKNII
jgi:peptidyl-prolyl cis-trans isomerase D